MEAVRRYPTPNGHDLCRFGGFRSHVVAEHGAAETHGGSVLYAILDALRGEVPFADEDDQLDPHGKRAKRSPVAEYGHGIGRV